MPCVTIRFLITRTPTDKSTIVGYPLVDCRRYSVDRNLARVKKEVLAFSRGTNQTMMVILKWRIKSWMNYWSDLIHLKSTHICCLESSHMLKMAFLKEKIKVNMIDTLTCRRSEAMAFGLKVVNSSGSNSIFIRSWVNRYVVLLRGMHHVDRQSFISAPANPYEFWVFEWQKS